MVISYIFDKVVISIITMLFV